MCCTYILGCGGLGWAATGLRLGWTAAEAGWAGLGWGGWTSAVSQRSAARHESPPPPPPPLHPSPPRMPPVWIPVSTTAARTRREHSAVTARALSVQSRCFVSSANRDKHLTGPSGGERPGRRGGGTVGGCWGGWLSWWSEVTCGREDRARWLCGAFYNFNKSLSSQTSFIAHAHASLAKNKHLSGGAVWP